MDHLPVVPHYELSGNYQSHWMQSRAQRTSQYISHSWNDTQLAGLNRAILDLFTLAQIAHISVYGVLELYGKKLFRLAAHF